MFDVNEIRKQFPMLTNNIQMQGMPLVYFDNAATTLKPKCVEEAIKKYYEEYTSNAHRGDYDLETIVDKKIDECRNTVAEFIGAQKDEIIFTSGTTMSLNLAAFGFAKNILQKDDEVIISELEHASNVLPWYKLAEETGCKIKFVELEDKKINIWNIRKAITKKTKIISLAYVSNVLGYQIEAKKIAQLAHEHGVYFILDGAQAVPHMPINVKEIGCDFLAFSGHKMCGPTGVGVLYCKKELMKKMNPIMYGGGMNESFDNKTNYSLVDGPAKFEAGTVQIESIIGLNEAVKFLLSINIKDINEYERNLKEYAVKKLSEIDDIEIYNSDAKSGIIAFNSKTVFAQDLATFLNSKGIAVRSGNHCAKMLPNVINNHATVRMSLYFYNTKEEIDLFVEACKHGGDFLDAYF